MLFDAQNLTNPLAALVAGLFTSVHCVGMCGPLTCAAFGRTRSVVPPVIYQTARIAAYGLAGGFIAAMGRTASGFFSTAPARFLPWAFAALFVAFAFGLEKRIPQPKAVARLLFRFRLAAMRPGAVAALLGFFTPLLPCGPLYLVLCATLLAGSFGEGALLMAAFGLGTVPLLFVLQTQFARLPFSAPTLQRVRQGLALVSAGLLVWRAVAGAGGLGAPMPCPACNP